ncbi:MAG: ferredoxin [Bacteriovoracaceae bacterium]|jgi:ferredoxin|nr:ferredoxin [Bacteriovoracaceae bacterium]
MPERQSAWEKNIPGNYFVDDQCIACDACVTEAPNFFEMNVDEGYAFVKMQPETPDQISDCENALAACPVEAIGNEKN